MNILFAFFPLVNAIGDICGYEGYRGSVDGVFVDVSCEPYLEGRCNTDDTYVDFYNVGHRYRIFRCICKAGWRKSNVNWKVCMKTGQSNPQYLG